MRCGVKVEEAPWAEGKHHQALSLMWFLANWANVLSWSEVARRFRVKWTQVYWAVETAVEWGRKHMNLEGITAIGIDEVQWHKGHEYLTLVYQINENCKRLLWIGKNREEETLEGFFDWLGKERTEKIKVVCSDMWKPYLNVIFKKVRQAIHVLDRFHIVKHLNDAVDMIRREEMRELKSRGQEVVLKDARWCLLKRPENQTDTQKGRLAELLKINLKSVRGYLLKEDFQLFWNYKSPYWAGRFLEVWNKSAMRSRLEPMKKVAQMLRGHHELILNWFRVKKKYSCGIVEGFNNRVKLTIRKSYGFKTQKITELVLYHTLGDLPQPDFTHKFW
jgi:transposase